MSRGFYYSAGLGFLALARMKYSFTGYTPKPFDVDEIDRCIDYDRFIANRFIRNLEEFGAYSIEGKHVLELGPGSDLGVGLLLVSQGAASYTAFDRNDLVSAVPTTFYEALEARDGVDLTALSDGRVTHIAREDFDLERGLGSRPAADIVFSNAAFEHFDDVAGTIRQLGSVVSSNALLIAEVDLQTHSRWIREVDPNNIYRYPQWLYAWFKYPGQPNRVRPETYRQFLEENGWHQITLWPENTIETPDSVHSVFAESDMSWLSFVACARRGAGE